MEGINPWTTLNSKSIYDNPWINVTEYDVLNPNGGKGIYDQESAFDNTDAPVVERSLHPRSAAGRPHRPRLSGRRD